MRSKAIHGVSKSGSGWPPSRTTEAKDVTNMKVSNMYGEKCMQRSGRKFEGKGDIRYSTGRLGPLHVQKCS